MLHHKETVETVWFEEPFTCNYKDFNCIWNYNGLQTVYELSSISDRAHLYDWQEIKHWYDTWDMNVEFICHDAMFV